MKISTKANLYLILVSVIWGATFPIIGNAANHVNPFLFVSARFTLAAIIMLPLVYQDITFKAKKLICYCIIFGIFNCISYVTQTIGLETISASRSAFITGFSVVLVPFIAPLLKLDRIKFTDIICSIICLYGLYILTGSDLEKITRGDVLTFICALSFAFLITFLQKLSTQHANYRLLTFYQLIFTAPFAACFAIPSSLTALLKPSVLIALSYCTIFATALCFFIQTKYQKFTTAPKAALIYSLEPIFASIFGYLINHETISKNTVWGGLIILISITLPNLLSLLKDAEAQPT